LADAKPLQLGHVAEADARWRIYAFAGKGDAGQPGSAIHSLSAFLESGEDSPVVKYTRPDEDIDAVIDCSATGPAGIVGPFPDTDPAVYGDFLSLSAGWLQRLAHAAYQYLAEDGGTLIAFVSDAGVFAAPRQTLIGAARAASIGFIRNFAMEAARDGIRAHAISPSFVDGSESARRMGSERMAKAARRAGLGLPTAQDIAPLALFLCSDGAAKITGQVVSVNGGLNC